MPGTRYEFAMRLRRQHRHLDASGVTELAVQKVVAVVKPGGRMLNSLSSSSCAEVNSSIPLQAFFALGCAPVDQAFRHSHGAQAYAGAKLMPEADIAAGSGHSGRGACEKSGAALERRACRMGLEGAFGSRVAHARRFSGMLAPSLECRALPWAARMLWSIDHPADGVSQPQAKQNSSRKRVLVSMPHQLHS